MSNPPPSSQPSYPTLSQNQPPPTPKDDNLHPFPPSPQSCGRRYGLSPCQQDAPPPPEPQLHKTNDHHNFTIQTAPSDKALKVYSPDFQTKASPAGIYAALDRDIIKMGAHAHRLAWRTEFARVRFLSLSLSGGPALWVPCWTASGSMRCRGRLFCIA